MKGGRLYMALAHALKASAPVATLLVANEVIKQKRPTIIPPKNNRGSTKRLTRKSKRSNRVKKLTNIKN